ncbi:decarboxylase [Alicyclobacillus cycloheptanicus]|uniref:Arginine/lysine/ornithine decarboxylase n=1 Tax=Alicyclobacillus cycloheptanicus TaxID=1457 RepID=A0ABT9XKC0_9BACL|nr:decarboxylase [Alicyclobacillus cycloheptanicus]MDQ0190186.1 arginine/lysine/ornithine decarboxylase [Alicyclobacillus cycloheptanicus]WDM02563.1 decarboxylase [Alicyclobacillus cycloheptanicus]
MQGAAVDLQPMGPGDWPMEETPVLAALVKHASMSRFPLHVPGHQQGRMLPRQLLHWLGSAARLDLTELPGLDNFHHPEGCMEVSQQLTAGHYGSDACFFSVNGSTAGVVAAIAGVVQPGGRVLFLNPFHQSAWNGLVFAGAQPVLPLAFFGRRDIRFVPEAWQVEQVMQHITDVDAVYLTSPTYRGQAAPVAAIARVVHQRGLPLIVDEAHGAHFGLHPAFPQHSVAAGADVVIQSVHKTLPGLTQTAWVHCTGPRVDRDRVATFLRQMHTTSPSYLLLASLDVAQAWLRFAGPGAARRAMEILAPVEEVRASMEILALAGDAASVPEAPSVSGEGPWRDPLRHWVPTSSLRESRRLQGMLAEQGLFVEYGDWDGVLSLFGFGVTPEVVDRYLGVLEAWRRSAPDADSMAAPPTGPASAPDPLRGAPAAGASEAARGVVDFVVSPRDAAFAGRVWVPIEQSQGRIAALPVTPYPPGVPVVWPGQRIDRRTLDELRRLWPGAREEAVEAAVDVHGVRPDGTIAVIETGRTSPCSSRLKA